MIFKSYRRLPLFVCWYEEKTERLPRLWEDKEVKIKWENVDITDKIGWIKVDKIFTQNKIGYFP